MDMRAPVLLLLALLASCVSAEWETKYGPDPKSYESLKASANVPVFWRAVIGDICQLPSFPRASGHPEQYLECVRVSEDNGGRSDLGVWILNKCLPEYEFVPYARRCRPVSTIRRQQQQLCQQGLCQPSPIQVTQTMAQPQSCPCPIQGMTNCVCPGPQMYQPTMVQQQQPQPIIPQPVVQPTSVVGSGCCSPQIQILVGTCPCQPQTIAPPIITQPPFTQPPFTQPPFTMPPQTLPPITVTPAPPVIVNPQPCPQAPQGAQGAQENGICSWMLAPLAPFPGDNKFFLQCQPAPWNLYCGRWRKMPCSIYTIFDVNLQVCTWDPNAPVGPLGPAQPQTLPTQPPTFQPTFFPQPSIFPTPQPIPVTQPPAVQQSCGCSVGIQIGFCGGNFQCPGLSVCQVTTQQQPIQQTACGACCYFGQKYLR